MVDLGAKIADGRTAEIYAWADGQVIKLLRPGLDPRALEQEADVLLRLDDLRLPMPRLVATVDVAGRPGIVLERVAGRPISVRPWKLRSTGQLLGELHAAVHRRKAAGHRSGLPALVDRLRAAIEAAELPPAIRERALSRLRELPDGDRICHGDFHPGNVLMTAAGPMLIDWVDAARGHPAADVARTVLLVRVGRPSAGPRSRAKDLGRALLTRTYLRAYPTPMPRPWLLPVAAARLSEEVHGEHDHLLTLIEDL